MNIDDITKEDFEAFEGVRISGMTNMISPMVRELIDIDKETHLAIMKYYGELCDKYPDVRPLE